MSNTPEKWSFTDETVSSLAKCAVAASTGRVAVSHDIRPPNFMLRYQFLDELEKAFPNMFERAKQLNTADQVRLPREARELFYCVLFKPNIDPPLKVQVPLLGNELSRLAGIDSSVQSGIGTILLEELAKPDNRKNLHFPALTGLSRQAAARLETPPVTQV